MFHRSPLISNMYRTDFAYIGIALHNDQNLSARCFLYGSSNDSVSKRRQLLRLLYILISCGILLLSLITCSIINDRRQARLKQQLQAEEVILPDRSTIVPKKSMTVFIDRGRKSSARRADLNRMTMPHSGSLVETRPSAVHSFSPSS
jgi:hypothetical protein